MSSSSSPIALRPYLSKPAGRPIARSPTITRHPSATDARPFERDLDFWITVISLLVMLAHTAVIPFCLSCKDNWVKAGRMLPNYRWWRRPMTTSSTVRYSLIRVPPLQVVSTAASIPRHSPSIPGQCYGPHGPLAAANCTDLLTKMTLFFKHHLVNKQLILSITLHDISCLPYGIPLEPREIDTYRFPSSPKTPIIFCTASRLYLTSPCRPSCSAAIRWNIPHRDKLEIGTEQPNGSDALHTRQFGSAGLPNGAIFIFEDPARHQLSVATRVAPPNSSQTTSMSQSRSVLRHLGWPRRTPPSTYFVSFFVTASMLADLGINSKNKNKTGRRTH